MPTLDENPFRNQPLWRAALAFLVAPLAPIVLILGLFALPAVAGADVSPIVFVAGTFLLGVVVPPTVFIAVPGYILARRLTRMTSGRTALAGAVIAFVGIAAEFLLLGLGSANWRSNLPDELLWPFGLGAMGVLPGALAGWAFWLVLTGWPSWRWRSAGRP